MQVRQVEPVLQVRWAGLSGKVKQASPSWVTANEVNGKILSRATKGKVTPD